MLGNDIERDIDEISISSISQTKTQSRHFLLQKQGRCLDCYMYC